MPAEEQRTLKETRSGTDENPVSDDRSLLSYLNSTERRVLGPLVRRMLASENPRIRRAMAETGAQATARMACVNALRLYAIVLFVVGTLAKLGHVGVLASALYVLAGAAMIWSFWCLYTVVGPEREFKRAGGVGHRPI